MLIEGRPWGGDCGAFTGVFDEVAYFCWLARMRRFQYTCLFVVVPDVVCNAAATLALFRRYATRVREMGFPIALVAQNGLRPFREGVFVDLTANDTDWDQDLASEFPEDEDNVWLDSTQAWHQTHVRWEEFNCLFIGGDVEWKLGEEAPRLIECARKAGKHVHIGRVNTRKRLRHFQLAGAHSIDGNALKFFDDNYPKLHQTLEQPTIFEGVFEEECAWQKYATCEPSVNLMRPILDVRRPSNGGMQMPELASNRNDGQTVFSEQCGLLTSFPQSINLLDIGNKYSG